MSDVHLIFPGMIVVTGLLVLLKPLWFRDARQREYRKQLAARMARGTDAYFEELRALKAYPPSRSVLIERVLGVALVLLGSVILFNTVSGR